ncbi:hypothetical protein ACFCX4_19560 [Kitasatospora sp. NPDC056327]|uniref:hypothetical protein n=1 Tax=Kitasatospora sp. NPDC056327 TaxID=3345785 RepID=UPI0035D9887A
MQTVDRLGEPAPDRAVREVRRRLAGGGADSLAHDPRPHLTPAACARMPARAAERIDALPAWALPPTDRPTGLLSFGTRSRRRVLARSAVPTVEPTRLHQGVRVALAGAEEPDPHHVPGRRSPHLGPTRRPTPEGVALTHTLLGRRPDLTGTPDTARGFDSATRPTRPPGAGR